MRTKSDLQKAIKCNTRQMDTLLKNFCATYNLKSNIFKKNQEETEHYKFSETVFELLKITFISMKERPLIVVGTNTVDDYSVEEKKKKITIDSLTKYYSLLIQEIENLPLELKNEIQAHPIYLNTLLDLNGMRSNEKKIRHLLAAMNELPDSIRGKVWSKLFLSVDSLILECYDEVITFRENTEKELRDTKSKINMEKEYLKNLPEDAAVLQETHQISINNLEIDALQTGYERSQVESIRSLDGLIVEMIKDDINKEHYKTTQEEAKRVRAATEVKMNKRRREKTYSFDVEKVQEAIKLDDGKLRKEDFLNKYESLIMRHTGSSLEELKQMSEESKGQKNQKKIKEIENLFHEIETVRGKAEVILKENSEFIDDDSKVENLNRRNIGMRLKSIENMLCTLHEDVDGVLYDDLNSEEIRDYNRVLQIVEETLGSINTLTLPMNEKIKMSSDYGKGLIDFYDRTLANSEHFEGVAQPFVLKTSVEALDEKVRR